MLAGARLACARIGSPIGSLNAVPEPGTLKVMGVGVAALAWMRGGGGALPALGREGLLF
jgi:hypothetical protein